MGNDDHGQQCILNKMDNDWFLVIRLLSIWDNTYNLLSSNYHIYLRDDVVFSVFISSFVSTESPLDIPGFFIDTSK